MIFECISHENQKYNIQVQFLLRVDRHTLAFLSSNSLKGLSLALFLQCGSLLVLSSISFSFLQTSKCYCYLVAISPHCPFNSQYSLPTPEPIVSVHFNDVRRSTVSGSGCCLAKNLPPAIIGRRSESCFSIDEAAHGPPSSAPWIYSAA